MSTAKLTAASKANPDKKISHKESSLACKICDDTRIQVCQTHQHISYIRYIPECVLGVPFVLLCMKKTLFNRYFLVVRKYFARFH